MFNHNTVNANTLHTKQERERERDAVVIIYLFIFPIIYIVDVSLPLHAGILIISIIYMYMRIEVDIHNTIFIVRGTTSKWMDPNNRNIHAYFTSTCAVPEIRPH